MSETLVIEEFKEINSYFRTNFQVYIAWYTFYLTTNAVSFGWFLNTLSDESKTLDLTLAYILGIFFLVSALMTIIQCFFVSSYIKKVENRLQEIIQVVVPKDIVYVPSPSQLYRRLNGLITCTSFGLLICWSIVLIRV